MRPPSSQTCRVEGCGTPAKARGFCDRHYHAARREGAFSDLPRCSEEGCLGFAKARGLCDRHYALAKRTSGFGQPDCSEPGCDRGTYAKGLCEKHYKRTRPKKRLRPPSDSHILREQGRKRCPFCGLVKDLAEFAPSRKEDAKVQVQPFCLSCRPEVSRLAALRQKQTRGRRYGLTEDELRTLLSLQGGLCAVCRTFETISTSPGDSANALAIDHDHADGSVRGLLCQRCNQSLGIFRDDPERILRAVAYLRNPPMARLPE